MNVGGAVCVGGLAAVASLENGFIDKELYAKKKVSGSFGVHSIPHYGRTSCFKLR